MITEHPDLFWGLIASMWIGNMMLLVLNLPMVGMWVRLLTIPYRLLYPAILVFCCIGVYSVANSTISVLLAAGFGVFGYVCASSTASPRRDPGLHPGAGAGGELPPRDADFAAATPRCSLPTRSACSSCWWRWR